MAQFTYPAVIALVGIIRRAGLEEVWADFLRAYGIRDIGVEPPPRPRTGYGDSAASERVQHLKEFGQRTATPDVQKFFERVTETVYQELVRPGLNRLGVAGEFYGDDRLAAQDLHRLERELKAGGYTFGNDGRLLTEDSPPSGKDIDAVTGIGTRGYLNEASARIFEQCRSHRLPCAAIFLDVDDFKKFNEECGYEAANTVLKAVAQAASTAIQLRGVLGRYGMGDEIVATVRNLTEDEAAALGERIRSAVGDLTVGGLTVTISVGVASSRDRKTVNELWGMAETALHRVKKQGKGQTMKFSQAPKNGKAGT